MAFIKFISVNEVIALEHDVYSVHDWYDAGDNRIAFNGALAPKDISDRFIGKKIPAYCKKGMAAPFLKSKN